MRELLKRLETLEAHTAAHNPPRATLFILADLGAEGEPNHAQCCDDGRELWRGDDEPAEQFETRAKTAFRGAPGRLAPLIWIGREPCMT